MVPVTEYSEHTWLIQGGPELLGETSDFAKAEEVVRAAYLEDHEWTEEQVGHRVGIDLHFGDWYITLDKVRQSRYCFIKIPKL